MAVRSYDIRVAALTLDVGTKWVDNLLSHHSLPGCSGSGRGVDRLINDVGLLAIAVVLRLNKQLGIPLGRAATLVSRTFNGGMLADPIVSDGGVRILVGVEELEREIRERLVDSLQSAPRIRRGRPRHS